MRPDLHWPGQRQTQQRQGGFTVLELLMVMVIVGVVAAALFYNQNRNRQRQILRDGAYQIVTELIRARSQAQRTSRDSTVNLNLSDASRRSFMTATGGAAALTRQLGAGLSLRACAASTGSEPACSPNDALSYSSVTFQAPYGTLDATGNVWQVTNTNIAEALYVKVVGITGKVVLSGSYAR